MAHAQHAACKSEVTIFEKQVSISFPRSGEVVQRFLPRREAKIFVHIRIKSFKVLPKNTDFTRNKKEWEVRGILVGSN